MPRLRPYVALAARAARANFVRPPFPYKLTFCVTYWCNYKCQTCNIWKMKPRDELRTDEIRRFFERSSGFSWVDITGGEVSLRKDFVDICEAESSLAEKPQYVEPSRISQSVQSALHRARPGSIGRTCRQLEARKPAPAHLDHVSPALRPLVDTHFVLLRSSISAAMSERRHRNVCGAS